MPRHIASLALAAALSAGAAHAQSQERCYGAALAGQNEGVGDTSAQGSSSVDYQGDAWIMVAQGTCVTLPLPPQPDGTPRRGALEPLARDPG